MSLTILNGTHVDIYLRERGAYAYERGLSGDPSRAMGYASVRKYNNPHIQLMDKNILYDKLFEIDGTGMVDIVYIRRILNANSETIDYVESVNPDIYIDYANNPLLSFLSKKPRLIILIAGPGSVGHIISNGISIDIKLSDIDQKTLDMCCGSGICDPKNTRFYKSLIRQFESGVNDVLVHRLRCIAETNVIRRLIIEFIAEYRDNPTLAITAELETTDNKSEMLSLIDDLQNQINRLKELINK